ncbi:hypothetical protein LBBP_00800 [Leptospira borgpetersenii serovar Ballum]|uniref:Uncharacterized protein n=1 Tax=Leptospira borgpetersenii serovar Ballum TaxID=280505 RepID=A0A0S2INA6_LEPBO|nr:hypothetical protein LBBP_00800 [Leptospira borgpetersenii serovar Ballum]
MKNGHRGQYFSQSNEGSIRFRSIAKYSHKSSVNNEHSIAHNAY